MLDAIKRSQECLLDAVMHVHLRISANLLETTLLTSQRRQPRRDITAKAICEHARGMVRGRRPAAAALRRRC